MSDNPLARLREAKTVDEALQEVVAARRTGTDPKELFGGPRDWIDSIVPPLVFVPAFWLGGLNKAIVVALIAEALVVGVRLVRRETLRHAFSGAFGIVFAALIAKWTHSGRGFFLPGIVINGLYAAGFLVSVAIGKPVIGYVARLIQDKPEEWHRHPTVKRAYAEVTLIWTATYLLRVAVQGYLFLSDRIGWLAVTKIVLGYPVLALAIGVSIPYLRWRTRDVPVPESPPEEAAEAEAEPGEQDAPAEAP